MGNLLRESGEGGEGPFKQNYAEPTPRGKAGEVHSNSSSTGPPLPLHLTLQIASLIHILLWGWGTSDGCLGFFGVFLVGLFVVFLFFVFWGFFPLSAASGLQTGNRGKGPSPSAGEQELPHRWRHWLSHKAPARPCPAGAGLLSATGERRPRARRRVGALLPRPTCACVHP